MIPIMSKSSSLSVLIWAFHGHFHQMPQTYDTVENHNTAVIMAPREFIQFKIQS